MTQLNPGFLRALRQRTAPKAALSTSILPFAAAVCLATPALAQTAAPSPSPAASGTAAATGTATLLDEVVVTATRTDETAAHITSAYTKIDDQEMKAAQLQKAKDAVDLSPGVTTRASGADGATSAVSIRGNRSVDTLFLVDGIKSDSVLFGNGGAPLMNFASSYNLRDVEVVRGPHSSLYGPEAIGGVVAMETKRGSGTPTTTAFFEGGSYNSFKEGLVSGGSLGKLDYSLHYAREDTDNDRANNRLGVNSASLRLDYTVSDGLTVGASVRTQQANYQEPGSNRNVDVGFDDPNQTTGQEATTVSTYAELKINDVWTSKLTLGLYRERYVLDDPFNPQSYLGSYQAIYWIPDNYDYANPVHGHMSEPYPDYSNSQTHAVTESQNWSADWKNTFQLTDTNKLVAGAALLYQAGHYQNGNEYVIDSSSYDSKTDITYYGSSLDVGAYLEDQWEVVKNLTLMGSLRYDHYLLQGTGDNANHYSGVSYYGPYTGSSETKTDYDINDDVLTYRIGAAYLVEPTHTKFHTSLATGFKEPTVYQINSAAAANGSALDPERSVSWDAGVDQYLLNDKLVLGATFFQNYIDNLIQYMYQPTPKLSYYSNCAEAKSHGIEAGATAKLTDRWNFRLAYTWTESEQSKYCWTDAEINETRLTGLQRALRVPRHAVNADTNYTFDLPRGKLTLGAGATWIIDRQDLDWGYYDGKPVYLGKSKGYGYEGRIADMPDYLIARVYARYALNDHVAFTARVENLTNKGYEPVLGYPAPGRTYYGGVEVTF